MAKKGDRTHLYRSRSGHLHVMSEFLMRGYNVAIPEVDVGDDIYVVEDSVGNLKKVQVKYAKTTVLKNGFSAKVNVPIEQLRQPDAPVLTYVFAFRLPNGWEKLLIIRRQKLWDLHQISNVGTHSDGYSNVQFHFSYSRKKARPLSCSKVDLSDYLD
ncbi:MAG: hypothetical protein ACHQNE_08050, partial [Candidatus Kapaibacterium sp.]